MANSLTESITEDQKIEIFVNTILSLDPTSTKDVQVAMKLKDDLGIALKLKVVNMSDIIKKPLQDLDTSHKENEKIADNLDALRHHVNILNPTDRNFSRDGIVGKVMDLIPFLPSPLEKYKEELQSGEKAIGDIIKALENGEKQLIKDNESLMRDQMDFWNNNEELKKSISFAMKIDSAMEKKLETLDEAKQTFIRQKFLFGLRQHTLDLQQQSTVFHQADLSTNILIENNQQLITSVQRTKSVTISALQVATMTSFALMHQKNVMKKIDSVNKTTSHLLSQNSKSLKEQGAMIQKQATTSMLDLVELKTSYNDLNEALDDITKFREVTLIDMKKQIADYESFIATTNKHALSHD